MEGEKMKCSRIQKMISRFIDCELSLDEKKSFALHIQDCSGCRKELEETQAVHKLFVSAERFPAPYGFATRVMANLEEKEPSRFRRIFTLRPFFLRAVEAAFTLIMIVIGLISGNVLVAERSVPQREASVERALSLDVFQATPPDSIAGIYVTMMGVGDER
jgi:anti-sigma factor RsiW